MLFLAMSCLQARLQDAAFDELSGLGADGVQLTPGNLPCAGFRDRLEKSGIRHTYHHAFAWERYREDVWKDGRLARPLARGWSVHPPKTDVTGEAWLEDAIARGLVVETMYPGYRGGTGDELEMLLDSGVSLAVDISHLFIQRCRGVLPETTLRRVLASDRIAEIHVSANDGRGDQHRPISASTPWLAWAQERGRSGVPIVLESYFHRLSRDERMRQVDLARGEYSIMRSS